MFAYIEQANWLIINNDFDKATAMLKPHVATNPFCTVELMQMDLYKAYLLADITPLNSILSMSNQAETVIKNCEKSDKTITDLIAQMVQLNQKCKESPVDGYVQRLDNGRTRVPLEQLNSAQQTYNFKLALKVMSAEVDQLRSCAHVMLGNPMKALLNIRSCHQVYEELYTTITRDAKSSDIATDKYVHPDIFEIVKYGCGMEQYLLGAAPSFLHAILNLIGFTPDTNNGIKLLQEVVDGDGIRLHNSLLALSNRYLIRPDGFDYRTRNLEAIKDTINRCVEKFPRSSSAMYHAAFFARKSGDMDLAIQRLTVSIDSLRSSMNTVPRALMSDLAQFHLDRTDTDAAVSEFEECTLRSTEEFDGRSFSTMYLAACYTLQDKFTQRNDLIKNMDKYISKKYQMDKYVEWKLKYLKGVKEPELNVLLACYHVENLYSRDRFDDLCVDPEKYLVPLLKEVQKFTVDSSMSIDVKAAKMFCETVIQRRLGTMDASAATTKFKNIIVAGSKIKHEYHWVAFAHLELADLAWKDKNYKQASTYINDAMKVKYTTVDDNFEYRLKRAKLDIKREKKASENVK